MQQSGDTFHDPAWVSSTCFLATIVNLISGLDQEPHLLNSQPCGMKANMNVMAYNYCHCSLTYGRRRAPKIFDIRLSRQIDEGRIGDRGVNRILSFCLKSVIILCSTNTKRSISVGSGTRRSLCERKSHQTRFRVSKEVFLKRSSTKWKPSQRVGVTCQRLPYEHCMSHCLQNNRVRESKKINLCKQALQDVELKPFCEACNGCPWGKVSITSQSATKLPQIHQGRLSGCTWSG
eukprot:3324234-Amphidinium_carterae.1